MRIANTEFGALPTVGVRVAVASLCLLPLLFWQGHGRTLLRHSKQLLLVGMLNSAIPFVCFSYALLAISSGLASILNATVPLSEMFGYSTDLRSRTQGRATYTMQFSEYSQVPEAIAQEIVKRVRGE